MEVDDEEKGKTPSIQRPMADSSSPLAERHVQPIFMKSFVLSGLLIGAIFGLRAAWRDLPDRAPQTPAAVAISFVDVPDTEDWSPLRLVGRWRMQAPDPRLAGLSALGADGGELLAVSDAGSIVQFPKPGAGGLARFVDLPSGPGAATYKSGRDSEALVADPRGRGWWIGFENGDEVRLFDPLFQTTIDVISLRGLDWHHNRGIEALTIESGAVTAYPEDARDRISIGSEGPVRSAQDGALERLADIASLPGGGQVAISRSLTPLGVRSRLMVRDRPGGEWRLLMRLPVGRLTIPEGIVAEARANGIVRLWMVTDNDFRRRVPTELIAVDWKP